MVKIRPFESADAGKLAELCNNKKIFDNLRDYIPYPYTLQDARDFINHCQVHDPPMNYAILHGDELCGAIGLVPQTDVYTGSAEIGYWLGEPYWGKGIMTRAVRLMVSYGFEKLDLRRIFTSVFAHNPASARVLEKAGFQFEGTGRKAVIKNGIVRDELRYAILKTTS